MKLLRHLLETPMRIDDFQDYAFDDPASNTERYKLFLTYKPKKRIGNINGIDVYEFMLGDNNIIVGLYEKTKSVRYYCNYEIENEPKVGRTCTQIMLWTDRSKRVKDLARTMFFRHLLKKFKTMQTDTMQTLGGEKFWIKNIKLAFEVGYNVYLYNKTSHNVIYVESPNKFNEYYTAGALWGRDFSFADTTILISTKELKTS